MGETETGCDLGAGYGLELELEFGLHGEGRMERTDRIPTPNNSEIPNRLFKLICRPQMIFCGRQNMVTSLITCTLAEQSITSGRE